MVGLVIVSHSAPLANAARDLAAAMGGDVRIEVAGGGPDGTLGAHAAGVEAAAVRAESGDGVVLIGDLGSAVIAIRTVLEDDGGSERRFADAPLVEGLIAAAVTASAGGSLEDVVRAAEDARHAPKR